MLQIASLSVARDIQSRAHADAARDRHASAASITAATPDNSVVQGKRWIARFRTVLPLHRRSADQLGA